MKPIWNIFAKYIHGRDPNAWISVCLTSSNRAQALKHMERMIQANKGKISAICVGHWIARKGICVLKDTLRTFDVPPPVELRTHATPQLIKDAQTTSAREVATAEASPTG